MNEAKAYHKLWSDAWALFRQWMSGFENSDSFFKRAGDEATEFVQQHKPYEDLATGLMMDILMELGRISRATERTDNT